LLVKEGAWDLLREKKKKHQTLVAISVKYNAVLASRAGRKEEYHPSGKRQEKGL